MGRRGGAIGMGRRRHWISVILGVLTVVLIFLTVSLFVWLTYPHPKPQAIYGEARIVFLYIAIAFCVLAILHTVMIVTEGDRDG